MIPTVDIDEWAEKDNAARSGFTGRFEPREVHEGNAARAVFYYRAMYPERVAAAGSQHFFNVQLNDLLRWASLDPVDALEAARSSWIAVKEGGVAGGRGENPFVLDSTLARRAYAPGTVAAEPGALAGTLALRLVGPNPFRGSTAIALTLAEAAEARVEVFDALGRSVATLHVGMLGAGEQRLTLDASELAPGVYVVRVVGTSFAETRRLTVVR